MERTEMGRTGYDMKFSLSLFPDWYEFVRCQANREIVCEQLWDCQLRNAELQSDDIFQDQNCHWSADIKKCQKPEELRISEN